MVAVAVELMMDTCGDDSPRNSSDSLIDGVECRGGAGLPWSERL